MTVDGTASDSPRPRGSDVVRCSVVVPVYNRIGPLRRALQSLADQTFGDFECLVVDDASSDPVGAVVAEFDERFRYVPRATNGGGTAARLTGCEHAKGDIVASLDSDNEWFPWALERALHYLDRFPVVDAAIGLFLFPDGLRVRVAEGVKVVGPDEFVRRSSPSASSDCVGVYRRCLLDDWSRLRRDYFNLDFVFELSMRLSHSVVLVDEPWGRYDSAGADRVSGNPDPRRFQDFQRFVDEFRPIVGTAPCGPVDVALVQSWQGLVRARRYSEAAIVADWMRERGISRMGAVRRKLSWAARARLLRSGRVHVF